MTLELFFVAASFVVGVGQVVDSVTLVRNAGQMTAVARYFSLFETLWAAFCVYLLVTGQLTSSRWLAWLFLAYLPMSLVVALSSDRHAFTQHPDSFKVPKLSAAFGGMSGVVYSVASLYFLARL